MIHGLKEMQIKAYNRNLAPQTVAYFFKCVSVGEKGHVSAHFSAHSYISFIFLWRKLFFFQMQ